MTETRQILILEEIAKEALKKERGYLFGKRDFVTIENEKFDFFFHFLENPIKGFANSDYRLGRVMPYAYPEQEDEAKVEMSRIFLEHPFISDFTLNEKGGKRESSIGENKRIVTGDFLVFFHTTLSSLGVEISREEYSQIDYELFRRYVEPEIPGIADYLNSLRSEIDQTCR